MKLRPLYNGWSIAKYGGGALLLLVVILCCCGKCCKKKKKDSGRDSDVYASIQGDD